MNTLKQIVPKLENSKLYLSFFSGLESIRYRIAAPTLRAVLPFVRLEYPYIAVPRSRPWNNEVGPLQSHKITLLANQIQSLPISGGVEPVNPSVQSWFIQYSAFDAQTIME